MSIPADSPWRGCASSFRQPVTEEDFLAAQFLTETVYHLNCRVQDHPLDDVLYRDSTEENDVIHHVFRWDSTPHSVIFENGFQARRQENTRDETYFNLDHYVHHGGKPLDSTRPATHAFVSTTLSTEWHPTVTHTLENVYRYEIFAPGGIWVAETLAHRYKYTSQDEVCFVAGIAPQYIRSVQRFKLVPDGRFTKRVRVDEIITINGNFNPQSHPKRLLKIQRPVFDRKDKENHKSIPLIIRIWRPQLPQQQPQKRDLHDNVNDRYSTSVAAPNVHESSNINAAANDWYTSQVVNVESYINAAFRSSRKNEVYLFMKNEYLLMNYAPGSTDDKVYHGPLFICQGYPSLANTPFGENGIDCAFGSHFGNECFIFHGNLCAHIDYAPGTTDDKILNGPKTIASIFPFLKKTVFENGVDAAFESTTKGEAYLFKGNQYALINYTPSHSHLIAIRPIAQGYPSLKGTIFETGIDAAFASHRSKEAYIFKGKHYALINFAPGTTDDYIIGGVKEILPNWPSLRNILPRRNNGIDIHEHKKGPDDHRDHDEL